MNRELWNIWIKSSLAVLFRTAVDGTLFVLEEEFLTDPATPRVELRVNGPCYTDHTQGETSIEFDISLLILTVKNPNDLYAHDRIVGLVARAISQTINIQGSGNYFGCAQQQGDVRIIPWGEIDKAPGILQTTVESAYKITL